MFSLATSYIVFKKKTLPIDHNLLIINTNVFQLGYACASPMPTRSVPVETFHFPHKKSNLLQTPSCASPTPTPNSSNVPPASSSTPTKWNASPPEAFSRWRRSTTWSEAQMTCVPRITGGLYQIRWAAEGFTIAGTELAMKCPATIIFCTINGFWAAIGPKVRTVVSTGRKILRWLFSTLEINFVAVMVHVNGVLFIVFFSCVYYMMLLSIFLYFSLLLPTFNSIFICNM